MLKIRVCSQVLKFTRYTIQYDWEGVDDWSRIWDYHLVLELVPRQER